MWLKKGDRAVLVDVLDQAIGEELERSGQAPEFLPALREKLQDPMEWEERDETLPGELEKCGDFPGDDIRCPHCKARLRGPDDRGWMDVGGVWESECHHCGAGLTAYPTSWVVCAGVEEGAVPPSLPKEEE